MHKFTSLNKIAPKLIFVDSEENPFVVVMEYIDGRLFDFSDFKNKEIMDKIIKYLKIIHTANTKPNLSKVSMMEEAQRFVNQLKKENVALPSEFNKWHQSLIEEYKKVQHIKLVPTHGDLWTKNILIGKDGNVYFIDFQESRYDDPLCDLGYFLYGSGIEDLNDIEMFTSKYLGRKVTKRDMENVLFYIKASAFIDGLYRFLWIKNIKTSKQLDKILLNIKHNASFYFQRGDYSKDEFNALNSEDKVKYVLSFFKGFLEMDMKMRHIK
jgi:thiamine kinase-like enzyme